MRGSDNTPNLCTSELLWRDMFTLRVINELITVAKEAYAGSVATDPRIIINDCHVLEAIVLRPRSTLATLTVRH